MRRVGKRIRPEDIKVISYVHVGETLVNTEDLTPQQRQRMADVLKAEWMNGLFQGRAVFKPAE